MIILIINQNDNNKQGGPQCAQRRAPSPVAAPSPPGGYQPHRDEIRRWAVVRGHEPYLTPECKPSQLSHDLRFTSLDSRKPW